MIIDEGVYKTISINEIEVDWNHRVRKQYNNIDLLADNIRGNGLINPLTVYSPTCNPPYKLMAGGRRYKALSLLKAENVPVRIYNRLLSNLELRAIELYENSQRSNLPFNEEVALTREINEAFKALHGHAVQGKKDSGGHGMKDTARILNRSIGSISTDIALAEAIEKYPELQLGKTKNKASAMLKLKRFQNIITAQVAAKQTQLTEEDCGYFTGDFFANKLPSNSFQFIEVDPPYGIDLVEIKRGDDQQQMKDNYEEVPVALYPEFITRLACECGRLAADNSWIIVWFAPRWQNMVWNEFTASGFIMDTIPATWKKGNSPGQCHNPHISLASSVEWFLYGRKGNPQLRKQGRSNLFDFPTIAPQIKALMHPTARPVELLTEIISTFCWPGYNILVPFAGSGNTIIAAQQLGYKCVGFDKSVEFRDNFVNHWMGLFCTQEK